MQNTRLWEAFSTLNKSECRTFDKFVRSPFFNQKKHLVGLLGYLRQCLESGVTPESGAAYSAAYPGQPYDDQKFRLANSDLLRLLSHYWIYQENFADQERNKIRLSAACRRRNLPRHAEVAMREARKGREQSPWRHAEHFDDLYQIELEEFQTATAARRYDAFNLQQISDLLDLAYVARKLRLLSLARSHQTVVRKDYHFGLLEPIMAFVKEECLLEEPSIALYYHASHFLSDPSAEDHFFQFQVILGAQADRFPPDELRALYLLAINFGIKKCNEATDMGWYRATFNLYQDALERDLLLENGLISRFAYHNIVGVAIRLQEAAWAESFLHRYKPHLERRYREAAFSLNMARVDYTRKDYRAALLHLQQADYKDFINSLNAKTLQLKIYYETGEFDLLESHLQSMDTFIRRQRAVGYHRDNYRNIVRYTRALMRLNSSDSVERAALRRQIEAESVLTEKEWLLRGLEG